MMVNTKRISRFLIASLTMLVALLAFGQQPPSQNQPQVPAQAQQQTQSGQQQQQTQAQQQQTQQTQTQQTQAQQPQTQPAPAPVAASGETVLNLQNASLPEVVDMLARQLKINYILPKGGIQGSVTLNTYGETKNINTLDLLNIILKINGYSMVKVGDLYRIVPMAEIASQPLQPEVNAKSIPEDDQIMLNLVFLKYFTVDDLAKVLTTFTGENAKIYTYAPANLLFILDTHRNMRRTMELISLFDSDTFANQRVRLYKVQYNRPSDLARDLDAVLKSISLNDKSSPVHFLPVDRINTLVAVAPNPGVFETVENWIKKLDIPITTTVGAVDNYVYRVRYGQAECLAGAITMLYGGQPSYGGGFGYGGGYGGGGNSSMQIGAGSTSAGFGQQNCGGMFGGGGGYGGYGGYGGNPGGYGYGGYGASGYGGMGMAPGASYGSPVYGAPYGSAAQGAAASSQQSGVATVPSNLTGTYLGAEAQNGEQGHIPRVVPNPLDNSLLIQATPQEYEGIRKLLLQLDVPPRQVLLEAKIYEVDLSGAFASGVSAYLESKTAAATDLPNRQLLANFTSDATNLSIGALVGESRALLAFLQLKENSSRARVVSAPSLIATDSIPATMNVGTAVPTLTAQAVSGATLGGTNTFAQSISNQNTGVTMQVLARVNPSGIVTLVINQQVSSPIAPAAGAIQSPSFDQRTVTTQITLQDGDTIAIGGIIDETSGSSSSGIPLLNRIPWAGALFGNKSTSTSKTELIIFMTPHVIYNMDDLAEASDELASHVKDLQKLINKQ